MNIQRIDFEAGRPAGVVVELTVEEAAQLAKWTGSATAGRTIEMSDMYRVLSQTVFNPYWSDGVDGYLNGDPVE